MISTTSHEVQSLPQIFKGRPKRTRHHEIRSAFSVDTPSRQSICFQGLSQCCQNEKTSHPGVWVNVSEFVCVTAFANHSLARTESKPVIGDGILTIFPFRPRWHYALASAPHFNPLAVCFRIDSPMSNCCSHGTFLHFSLQRFSSEYLLLTPRSALGPVPLWLTPRASQHSKELKPHALLLIDV